MRYGIFSTWYFLIFYFNKTQYFRLRRVWLQLNCSCNALDECLKTAWSLLTDCWLTADRMLTNCWPTADLLLTYCWPTADRLLTDCWPTADRLLTDFLTNCWLTADWFLTDCLKIWAKKMKREHFVTDRQTDRDSDSLGSLKSWLKILYDLGLHYSSRVCFNMLEYTRVC